MILDIANETALDSDQLYSWGVEFSDFNFMH